MPRRKTTTPVIASAQSVEQIANALSLLVFLSDPNSQRTAKVNLESLGTATRENRKALEDLQGRLAEVDAEAVADREAAAQELADAKAEAKVIITDANGKAEGRVAVLNERDADISARERSVENHEQALSDKEADFERETAGLRKALR